MLADYFKLRSLVFAATAGLLAAGLSSPVLAVAPTSFVAVLNENAGNSDSRKSVTFFDANDIGGGPLFSVFTPFEIHGGSSTAYEEPQTITVNPATGDIYMLAFDSGNTAGVVDVNLTPGDTSDDDTSGDLDLYRLNFQPILNHWVTNFQGKDVRTLTGPLAVGGPAPTTTGGVDATKLADYVTYGVATPYVEQLKLDFAHGPSPEGVFDQTHSNTFTLPGAIAKIGEVNRNVYSTTSNFWPGVIDFIDPNTLFYIDDARTTVSVPNDLAANDNDYRIIGRVSTSPGAATSDGINGGYNNTTTESWQSRRIGQVLLDSAGLSEPESVAFYADPVSGVRGVWVTEGDFPTNGDAVQFLELDTNNNVIGYRPYASGGAPIPPLDNDPAVGNDNLGSSDNVFIDKDTGDLIIVESSFNDASVGGTNTEPGVLRAHVNYNNGSGQIAITSWDAKKLLAPTKDPGDTSFELGYFSTYDSATDTVYFFSPGFTGETPPFEMDIYALNLATGVTTSFLDVDNSVSLFVGGTNKPFGDKAVAFTLSPQGVVGDYNNNGVVDAADYVVWRNAAPNATLPNDSTPGTVTAADYDVWRARFGLTSGSGSGVSGGAVPEPAGVVLMLMGLALLGARRRAT